MNKRFVFIYILAGVLLAIPAQSQERPQGDDFDLIVVPVAQSLRAGGHDLGGDAEELSDLGLTLVEVPNPGGDAFPLPEDPAVKVSTDRVELTLKPGEALRLLSDSIVTSATSVLFQADLTVSGAAPDQSAVAMIDIENLGRIGVLLSMAGDRVLNETRRFAYEFQPEGGQFQLLLQFVGPQSGEASNIVIERMRIAEGFRSLDYAVGTTKGTEVERFSPMPADITLDSVVTSAGGGIEAASGIGFAPYAGIELQSLKLFAESDSDLVRAVVPLEGIEIPDSETEPPYLLYAQLWARRLSGTQGTFSIALGSAQTGSLGVFETPIADIPEDEWQRYECPVYFDHRALPNAFLFLQMRDGAAEVLVDDISLRLSRKNPRLWNADWVPSQWLE